VKPSKSDVQAVIELSEEEYDRRVLSVDPDTGKVREVELGLEVKFSVRGRDGKLLIPPERLSWVQDFVFDENSLLGTTERESIIELELAQDAARSIMLRLETIEFPET
jgi:outer membrane lipopolysaccharide assembly protein LptE/RlpB